jgi:site-specific DNA-methyltransferase (adenine-specific)
MKKIGDATLYCADSEDVLPLLKDIDACVTDPPYGLSFMGKRWDYDVPQKQMWEKVFASLKNGSHLLSFFGSRTYHRGVIPIEDAGFEIRDQLMWLYGSGFPKSHNIGKAVDKLQGNKREVVGVLENEKDFRDLGKNTKKIHGLDKLGVGVSASRKSIEITKGTSEYEGWGTALKPAHEPIVMARKPIKGTVAENVLEHGTGGINIDDCRVETKEKITNHSRGKESAISKGKYGDSKAQETHQTEGQKLGRFPANVMHDGSDDVQEIFADKAHYFYCAKASKKDRDENNNHPTVKPTELMRYLCRLVTPKGGVVLDPFMGSGSTGKAAILEGFNFVRIRS